MIYDKSEFTTKDINQKRSLRLPINAIAFCRQDSLPLHQCVYPALRLLPTALAPLEPFNGSS
ncbi:hypothetical protein [Nostoc sp. MG11]|uniref:hypothetical protein n=1 Tax=Nostoc sp. MG11 TaxID=2721166 RepID=UPI0018669F0C|nr:hypothetical protein [Nostoc sp. MG11]